MKRKNKRSVSRSSKSLKNNWGLILSLIAIIVVCAIVVYGSLNKTTSKSKAEAPKRSLNKINRVSADYQDEFNKICNYLIGSTIGTQPQSAVGYNAWNNTVPSGYYFWGVNGILESTSPDFFKPLNSKIYNLAINRNKTLSDPNHLWCYIEGSQLITVSDAYCKKNNEYVIVDSSNIKKYLNYPAVCKKTCTSAYGSDWSNAYKVDMKDQNNKTVKCPIADTTNNKVTNTGICCKNTN